VPLVEDRLDRLALQAGVQLHALGLGHAVRRPGLQVVRLLGEVAAGVDVVVAGRHHVGVLGGVCADVRADRGGDVRPTGDGEAAALAEVDLHVHHHQGAGHRAPPQAVTVSIAQSPRDSANASGGIASRTRWWCARAAASASRG
jgi:hypothetical protein